MRAYSIEGSMNESQPSIAPSCSILDILGELFGNGGETLKAPKEDRRSSRRRQLLEHALFELMLKKRYDRITIQDIIARANVGRSTFYDHYEDKEDLAAHAIEQLMERLTRDTMQDVPEHQVVPVVTLFQHVQVQYPMFRAVAGGHAIDLFSERAQRYWSKQIEAQLRAKFPQGKEPTVPLTLVASFVSNNPAYIISQENYFLM
jgi:AcrR family transcriptional regulator